MFLVRLFLWLLKLILWILGTVFLFAGLVFCMAHLHKACCHRPPLKHTKRLRTELSELHAKHTEHVNSSVASIEQLQADKAIEIDTLRKTVARLEDARASLEAAKDEEIAALKAKKSELAKTFSHVCEQMRAYRVNEVAGVQKNVTRLEDQLKAAKTAAKLQMGEHGVKEENMRKQFVGEVAGMQARNQQLEKENAGLKEHNAALEACVDSGDKQLARRVRQLQELHARCQTQEREAERAARELRGTVQELQTSRDNWKRNTDVLNGKLERQSKAAEEEKHELACALEEMKMDRVVLQSQVNTLQSDMQVQSQASAVESQNSAVKVQRLETDLQTTTQRAEKAETQGEVTARYVAELAKEMELREQKAKVVLAMSAATLQAEIGALKTEVSDRTEKLEESATWGTAEREWSAMRAAALSKELEALKTEVKDKTARLVQCERRAADGDAVRKWWETTGRAERELSELRARRAARLTKEIALLKKEIGLLKKEIGLLKEEKEAELVVCNAEWKEVVKGLKGEVREKTERLEECELREMGAEKVELEDAEGVEDDGDDDGLDAELEGCGSASDSDSDSDDETVVLDLEDLELMMPDVAMPEVSMPVDA
ncbi:hypothetical protein BDV95DRAFT_616022 [Massariosphaeria phaeospora]|uniref:Uncharacterized protein n=1 Tax=Massariosphaeria phaeospora TaxID=100035 RepID=A0A7C8IE56_9PLEO|nr:hypothetical protein BDV95DRAFT_616022 [Massariosphaeria phaeospora]